MARYQRHFLTTNIVSVTAGSTDGQTLIDATAPFDGARIDRFHVTQKTAGTGTGSFTVLLEESGGTDLTGTMTVTTVSAAAGTIHGTGFGNGTQVSASGKQLAVVTAKSGTVVTGSPVMLVHILWQM